MHEAELKAYVEKWIRDKDVAAPLLIVGMQPDHPLLQLVEQKVELLELGEGGEPITMKNVQRLLEQLANTSFDDRRLIVIRAAERLLPVGANALLKSLEEAGTQDRFLLTTLFPGRLLPTIRSRCQTVTLARAQLQVDDATGPLPIFDSKRKTPLTELELHAIASYLADLVKDGERSAAVIRSFQRLRDCYKIRALGGNARLAGDVLLASLIELEH